MEPSVRRQPLRSPGTRHDTPAICKVTMAAGALGWLGDPDARRLVQRATLALASRRRELDHRTQLERANARGCVRKITAWPRSTGDDGGESWRLALVASLRPLLESD
jgi:hypothetical protein